MTGRGRGTSLTTTSNGGAARDRGAPPIPEGHEDDAFSFMLEHAGLTTLRGSPAVDREYGALICEQLDDEQPLDELVDDVAEGTGLGWETTIFVIWSAVVCYRREHIDTVLPPDRPAARQGGRTRWTR